ncbi:MAG: hypothetical protein ACJAUU_001116 [Rickettsiales bacterium]|jgi:hypothetical protein
MKPKKTTFEHLDKVVLAKALIETLQKDEKFNKEHFNSTTLDKGGAHKEIANCVIHLLGGREFSFNQKQSQRFIDLFSQEIKEEIKDNYEKIDNPKSAFSPVESRSVFRQKSDNNLEITSGMAL